MEKENLAIRISGVKKEYRLGNIGGRTLQADLQSWFARKRGREDPNVKIGQDERLVGQKFMYLSVPKHQWADSHERQNSAR